jgi:anthranilate synthase component 1
LYDFACAKLDFLERELERPLSRAPRPAATPIVPTANQTRETFETGVRRIQDAIAAGEVYQAVLSQRFDVETDTAPFDVYRALRHINPSPYMFFLRLGRDAIVGASPEMLVRVEGRHVETHPIAGTRPRGATPDEDQRLAEELRRNEKEKAEHVMLVDLGRNDVGRVAKYGTVKVREMMAVERYSHVLHLVSEVEGMLRDDSSSLAVLKAVFPAGTMTGAPKVRSMQVIDSLEPERRGPYAGAVGHIGWGDRRMDLAITIRTCVLVGDEASVQAGAGIVADSVPEKEWEETESKARAMLTAIGRVRRGSA